MVDFGLSEYLMSIALILIFAFLGYLECRNHKSHMAFITRQVAEEKAKKNGDEEKKWIPYSQIEDLEKSKRKERQIQEEEEEAEFDPEMI